MLLLEAILLPCGLFRQFDNEILHPHGTLVRLYVVELTKLVEIRDRIAGVPFPRLRRLGRQIGVGSFVSLRSPINARTLPWYLVSAGGGCDGVIHPGGVNHGDMCLTPEHDQIHPELLNIYHEIAERCPI